METITREITRRSQQTRPQSLNERGGGGGRSSHDGRQRYPPVRQIRTYRPRWPGPQWRQLRAGRCWLKALWRRKCCWSVHFRMQLRRRNWTRRVFTRGQPTERHVGENGVPMWRWSAVALIQIVGSSVAPAFPSSLALSRLAHADT